MLKKLSLVLTASITTTILGFITLRSEALTLSGNSNINPSDFRITTYASGLNYPTAPIRLSDGSLLVGVTNPNSGGNFFNNSVGGVVRLVDNNQDGVSDSIFPIFSGLPSAISAISQAGNLLFVTSTQNNAQRISVLKQGVNPQDDLSLIGNLNFGFPSNPLHVSSASVSKDTGSGQYQLFFNVGSQFNSVASTTPVNFTSSEFNINTTLEADSIYRINIDNSATNPSFSSPEKIAGGLRNAAALGFQSSSGDLYFADNGIDGLVNPTEPESADELNVLRANNIGGVVENYGFPNNYIQYRTGTEIGSGSVQPLAAFQPIPDPNTGSRSEGAAGLALAPSGFPIGLNNGVFVGFFGSFSPPNNENPILYYDLASGKFFQFIDAGREGIGYPIGLLSTDDSLFISDLSSTSNLFTDQGNGVIYQVQSTVPVPFEFEVPVLVWVGLGVYWILKKNPNQIND